MGLGISPPTLNALVRIAATVGELYTSESISQRALVWKHIDVLVENNCQCVIFMQQGYVYTDEKIFYDSDIWQGVLFPQALELLGPF